jgi:homoserine kinase
MIAGADSVRVFAPASIANLGPGFDCLGVAIDGPGDTLEARLVAGGPPGVTIEAITGDSAGIPLEAGRNCAGRAAQAVLARATGRGAKDAALVLRLHKGLPRGSGLGSSAASAVAGAVAAHLLLGTPLGSNALLEAALEGECVASGGRHADNLAASLLGGFTIVRSHEPLDVVRIEAPALVRFVVVLPAMELETRHARAILPESVPLKAAIANWANVAAMVAAFTRGNAADIGRAVVDRVVEPARKHLIPGFDEVRRAALDAGAHGCSISGAGPSVFAVATAETGAAVAAAMQAAFARHGLESRPFVCAPDNRGARRVDG